MKNCERFTELFSDYAEDGLSSAEKRELDVHLQQCSECRSAAAGVVNLRTSLRQMPGLTTSPDFETILRTRMKMERRPYKAPMWNGGYFAARRFATLATAVAAVGCFLYLWPRLSGRAFQPASPTIAVSQLQATPNGVLSSVTPAKIMYTLDRVTPQLLSTFGGAGRSPKRAELTPQDSLRTEAPLHLPAASVAQQPYIF